MSVVVMNSELMASAGGEVSEKASKRGRPLAGTAEQFELAGKLWDNDEVSLSEIRKMTGLTPRTIYRRLGKRSVKTGRKPLARLDRTLC